MRGFASLLCFILAGLSSNALAQSTIYLPYVVNDAGTVTEVQLTNLSTADATVTLSPYRADGTPSVPTSVTIPANGQLTASPDASFQGWVAATSNSSGVIGQLRVNSSSRLAQETTPAALPGATLVFPLVSQTAGAETEIALANPTANRARAALTIFDTAGKVIASADQALNAFGMVRGSIPALFGNDKSYASASHVIVKFLPGNILSGVAAIEGVGYAVVRNFAQGESSGERISNRSDWAATAGTPASTAAAAFTFPQVNRGQDWFSLFSVVNPTDAPATVTFNYSTSSNPNAGNRNISIPGNGAARVTAVDLFGPGEDSGVVRLSSTGNVIISMALGTLSGGGFAAAAGQASPFTTFALPLIDEALSSFTGIALLNDTADSASIEQFAVSAKGETLARITRLLLPGQRIVRDLAEEIPATFNTRGGFVLIRSTAPLFGMAVAGSASTTLNQLNAISAPSGYAPPAPDSAGGDLGRPVITGTVRDFLTNAPAAGVKITLTRPGLDDAGTISTSTDENGAYAFKNIPADAYSITPSQTGRVFTPPFTLVRLTDSSLVVDFVRETVPIISALTVITTDGGDQRTAGNNPDAFAVFGTAEVLLRIDGFNFSGGKAGQPAPAVYFGARQVPAQYVNVADTQTIFVRLILNSTEILAELAANGFYGRYEVSVAGPPPFDGTRSNTLPFFIVPPVPVLLSVEPQQTVARYEINSPSQPLTVTGFGFREGARLLFDGGTALNGIEIGTTFVNSTTLRAVLPPQALRYGGIYKLRVRNVSLLPEISGEAITFQVNNLAPVIQSVVLPVFESLGPGRGPVATTIVVNGSNFFPETTVGVTLKAPDFVPAIIPVNGAAQCVIVNQSTTLRVRVLNHAGAPQPDIPVTFTAPGINTNLASGAFIRGVNSPTLTVLTDHQGYAPPMADNLRSTFNANAFTGGYVVTASTNVGGTDLSTAFNITNIQQEDACVTGGVVNTVFINSHQILIDQYPISSRGTYGVVAANPSPGGGVSDEFEFEVQAGPTGAVPALHPLVPLTPDSVKAGTPGFTLKLFRDTASGVIFDSNAWVNFGTVRLDRVAGDVDGDVMTVFVPAFLIASPGIVPITVTNPGIGTTGGTSPRALFNVTP